MIKNWLRKCFGFVQFFRENRFSNISNFWSKRAFTLKKFREIDLEIRVHSLQNFFRVKKIFCCVFYIFPWNNVMMATWFSCFEMKITTDGVKKIQNANRKFNPSIALKIHKFSEASKNTASVIRVVVILAKVNKSW